MECEELIGRYLQGPLREYRSLFDTLTPRRMDDERADAEKGDCGVVVRMQESGDYDSAVGAGEPLKLLA